MRDALADLGQLVESASVSYAVIGGHAVNTWLEPRFTADIDVTLIADPVGLVRLRDALTKAGFEVAQEYGANQPSGPDFIRFVSGDRSVVIEFQVAKTELQRSVVARAKSTVEGVRVATPEDLLVLKLIADRAKDRVDLEGLARLSNLDWSYIEDRCAEWDLSGRLASLRRSVTST